MQNTIKWTPTRNSEREAARKFPVWTLIVTAPGVGPAGRVLVAPWVAGEARPDLDMRWVVPAANTEH